ncbi:nucleotide-diphospho-sugar transferase [Gigaspora margarita]|uniref:Nucleotide-diphospho-sugar transferase n=1 Tax=Gigaspora margarita TaxID=4874 RepID=A0A8H3XCR1_GIGMA|nr:nucleotide-diphospho-sugar transferase [Gigaspora margarita]
MPISKKVVRRQSDLNHHTTKIHVDPRVSPTAEINSKVQVGSDSLVGDDTKIDECTSIKHSTIGTHCTIGNNVKISKSILMDNIVIEDKFDNWLMTEWHNSKVQVGSDSLVGDDTKIDECMFIKCSISKSQSPY